jgi:hypothetical protein
MPPMLPRIRTLDWPLFWVLEVASLGIPLLLTVMLFRVGGSLPPRRGLILLLMILGLTILNFILLSNRRPDASSAKPQ